MNISLDRNLIFFDIESTGLNVVRDRIIQLAMIRYHHDNTPPIEKTWMINPQMPISPEATAVHGISFEDVQHEPVFEQLAAEIYDFIGDADLAGYNSNRFDIPVLMEEFARAGFDFDIKDRKTIDVQRIFYKMEPRTLSAAYQFYCQQTLENAHDALADVRATVEVLDGQLRKYSDTDFVADDGSVLANPVHPSVDALSAFTSDTNTLDVTQRLKYDHNGIVIFNFGKYIGRPVKEVLERDQQYYQWILNKEFSHQVKKIVREIVEGNKGSR